MTDHAIVRVSFQSEPYANQAMDEALSKLGFMDKVGTACYAGRTDAMNDPKTALKQLLPVIDTFWDDLDFLSITIARDSN